MQTLLVEAFGPLAVVFVIFIVVTGFRRMRHQYQNRLTPEQHQAARDSFRKRLVHPQPSEVERGIGAFLPERLIDLYKDHPTVLAEQLEIREPNAGPKDSAEWIEAFLPLDLESQKYTIDLAQQGWGRGFCFATDGAGNFYWTPVSETRQLDAPVFFASHDPYSNEEVAPSLDEFLGWPCTVHAPEAHQLETTA